MRAKATIKNVHALSAMLLVVFLAVACGPPDIQDADVVGVWTVQQVDYTWQFRDDRTFDNERGTEGVWSTDGQALIVTATNQGDNPSTWVLLLTDSLHLEGTWSDPYGNSGRLMLQRQ